MFLCFSEEVFMHTNWYMFIICLVRFAFICSYCLDVLKVDISNESHQRIIHSIAAAAGEK